MLFSENAPERLPVCVACNSQKGMNADKLSTAEDWSIAKRVHVGRLVESNNDGTSDKTTVRSSHANDIQETQTLRR